MIIILLGSIVSIIDSLTYMTRQSIVISSPIMNNAFHMNSYYTQVLHAQRSGLVGKKKKGKHWGPVPHNEKREGAIEALICGFWQVGRLPFTLECWAL